MLSERIIAWLSSIQQEQRSKNRKTFWSVNLALTRFPLLSKREESLKGPKRKSQFLGKAQLSTELHIKRNGITQQAKKQTMNCFFLHLNFFGTVEHLKVLK